MKEKRVYALAFHVDYWDYLGWADPFGDQMYSEYQRAYARAWKARRIYTPQTVVNGAVEFVGSDRVETNRSIARALEQEASVALYLNPQVDIGKGRILVPVIPFHQGRQTGRE